MATYLETSNFRVQYSPAEYTQSNEIALVQQRLQALFSVCEADYSTLCEWFGIQVGAGLGPSNRVVVTLTKSVNGGVNFGYSTHNPQIHVNPSFGAADEYVSGIFVAELIEILMSYTTKWDRSNSGGEGLSRVAAELLHPAYAPQGVDNYVNAWLASVPSQDNTSAEADTEYRKDWVSANFSGGPLKSGGCVRGEDDSYSYGCAMLFIYYLKDQLGYSMAQIVQNGSTTLDGTYRMLTNGRADGFSAFKNLLDAHFPIGNAKSPKDNPFPVAPLAPLETDVAPAAASSGDTFVFLVKDLERRIFYNWGKRGEGGSGWIDIGGQTVASPAATLVGTYLYVAVRGMDGSVYLNQGELGQPFVGWQSGHDFETDVAPAATSFGDTFVFLAKDPEGRIFYNWGKRGEGGSGWIDIGGQTVASPAATLIGTYLYVAVRGMDGSVYLNQGELGQPFVGWQSGHDFETDVAPAATSFGDTFVFLAKDPEGRIFYNWGKRGEGGSGWIDIGGQTVASPAATLIGTYLYVAVRGMDGSVYLNQGELGQPFVGWNKLN